jgi:hypothetical protein
MREQKDFETMDEYIAYLVGVLDSLKEMVENDK